MKSLRYTLAILLFGASALQAQQVGTILVAHGGSKEWNDRVYSIVKGAQTGGPVEVSFLMGPGAKDTRIQDVAARMEAAGVSRIVVVPLLISSHSGHYEQIRYLAGQTDQLDENMMHHLHMGGLKRVQTRVPVEVAAAIDDSPDVARVLAERARELVPQPQGRALFLVGHGPNSSEDLAVWMKNLRVLGDSVRALTGFRDVRVGLVQDDAPAHVRAEAVTRVREFITLQHELTGQDVAVVPVLISRGKLSTEKLPRDLANLPILYNGEPLLPHPILAKWIEARVREVTRLTSSR
jgi:sirohydrochlorin ferrochelatase